MATVSVTLQRICAIVMSPQLFCKLQAVNQRSEHMGAIFGPKCSLVDLHGPFDTLSEAFMAPGSVE